RRWWWKPRSRRIGSMISPVPAETSPVLPGPLAPDSLEAPRDGIPVDRVVLRPLAFDLDRTHQAAEAGAAQPVPAVGKAVEQAAAIGVAASGRIDGRAHRRRFHQLAG